MFALLTLSLLNFERKILIGLIIRYFNIKVLSFGLRDSKTLKGGVFREIRRRDRSSGDDHGTKLESSKGRRKAEDELRVTWMM